MERAKRGTLAGHIVAGHELIGVVAVGGMGEVYLARHLTLGMKRAIKVLRTDLRLVENARERFEREAQVLARLQHNSIVQIVEFGTLPNGWPFLAMEYIEGPNLDQLVDVAPLPLPSALVVLEQVAVALHYAHSLGVIHRDLKPSNVLVRSGDLRQVKLIDFGLARVIDAAKRLTADGQMIGSPLYMAPEQVEGERDATAAVDVYAFGGIAYTLLSARPPFEHPNTTRLLAAHVKEPPPRLAERCPDLPDFIDALLYSCLAKDPARRPRTDELIAHLGRLTRGADIAVAAPVPVAGPRIEVVDSPWSGKVSAQLLDEPLPRDPAGTSESLVERVMGMIVAIASHLSASDRELAALLDLEAKIREQLAEVERESELLVKQLALTDTAHLDRIAKQRDALAERARTLRAQQRPLQRRIIDVVERHRRCATAPMSALFHDIDRALDQLYELRRQA